ILHVTFTPLSASVHSSSGSTSSSTRGGPSRADSPPTSAEREGRMQDLIDRLPEPVQRTLGQALRLRRKELKRLRSSLVTAGLDRSEEHTAELQSREN